MMEHGKIIPLGAGCAPLEAAGGHDPAAPAPRSLQKHQPQFLQSCSLSKSPLWLHCCPHPAWIQAPGSHQVPAPTPPPPALHAAESEPTRGCAQRAGCSVFPYKKQPGTSLPCGRAPPKAQHAVHHEWLSDLTHLLNCYYACLLITSSGKQRGQKFDIER